MTEQKMVRVEVMSQSGNEEWTMQEFLKILAEIPPEHMASARIELDPTYDHAAVLQVFYMRPQTAEEAAEVIARREREMARHEEMQRMEYEALKAKFG